MFLRTYFLCLALFSLDTFAVPMHDYFVGLGSTFGTTGGFLQLQGGAGFTIYQHERFSLQLGPQANLAALFPPSGVLFLMDLDAFAKGKYALKLLNPGVSVYLKVPLGFSLLAGGGAGTVVPGFNFGILPGVELDLTEHYGMYAELGYMNRVFQGSASHSGSISLGLKVKF